MLSVLFIVCDELEAWVKHAYRLVPDNALVEIDTYALPDGPFTVIMDGRKAFSCLLSIDVATKAIRIL